MVDKNKPRSLSIRMYNVGFGDCFLLTFHYSATDKRHVLIDFGSTRQPKGQQDTLTRVARQIKEHCAGKLHVLVATHRHQDHISGFDKEKESGKIIASLDPDVVVQPWTEDPNAKRDARVPTEYGSEAVGFVQCLDSLDTIAARLRTAAPRLMGLSKTERTKLGFLGQVNITNKSAVKNLIEMGENDKSRYVHFGSKLGLDELLPGVNIHVLGPPTLAQSNAIRSQRARDPDEFWQLKRLMNAGLMGLGLTGTDSIGTESASAGSSGVEPRAAAFELSLRRLLEMKLPEAEDELSLNWLTDMRLTGVELPISARKGRGIFPKADCFKKDKIWSRWFKGHVQQARKESLMRIVRSLDDALNNTSVILLFEVKTEIDAKEKSTSVLFPGDAQIENWSYALGQPGVKELLRHVNVYKVGHHGSLNATPKVSLWSEFGERQKGRMYTLLSTREGVHGDKTKKTEVPRQSLVKELKKKSHLLRTDKCPAGRNYHEIELDFKKGTVRPVE